MLEHDKKTDIFLAHMGVCMHTEDTLEHKEKPKYIAKIGEGAQARYFYTMEAFNAYKKALSSKDEAAAVEKAQNHPDIKLDEYDLGNGRKITSWTTTNKEAGDALDKADMAYYESKTLKGKAKAVKETYKDLKETRQERKENAKSKVTTAEPDAKTAQESRTKKEVGSGVKEYGKALTSIDEKKKEEAAYTKAKKAQADYEKKRDEYKELEGSLKFKKKKEAREEMEKAAASANKANSEHAKAQQEYLDSKKASTRAKATSEVFNKRNPEVKKRIKKGRDWAKSQLR